MSVKFVTLNNFYDLIACFPNLKSMCIRFVDFRSVAPIGNIDELPTLKLKKLAVKTWRGDRVFKTLTELKVQCEEIFIYFHAGSYDYGEIKDLVGFLNIQENLISFGLSCFYQSTYVLHDLFASLLKMERVLTIRDLYLYDENDAEGALVRPITDFIDFLDVVKNSLRCLKIECRTLSASLLSKVINDLQIERLYIKAEYFYGNLETQIPNLYLKTLVLEEMRLMSSLFVIQVFKAFPNCQYLALPDLSDVRFVEECLISIEEHLKSLKYLQVNSSIPSNIPEVHIPSLSAIFYSNGNRYGLPIEGIRRLLSPNPNIQTLLIHAKFYGLLNHHDDLQVLDQLTQNLQSLKKLIIHKKMFHVNVEMLQMLSSNCQNLESFQVKTNSDKSNDRLKCGKVELRYFKKDVIDTVYSQYNSILSDYNLNY